MHTIEDVNLAISGLSDADYCRLDGFATWRMRAMGGWDGGRDREDLLSEAITATLSGARSWNDDVTFVDHLLGAMRSISSRWRTKRQPEIYLQSEFARSEESEQEDILNRAKTELDPERIFAAREKLRTIALLFLHDRSASLVLALLAQGYTGAEIQAALQMSSREYATVTKRIRRRLEMTYRRRPPLSGKKVVTQSVAGLGRVE